MGNKAHVWKYDNWIPSKPDNGTRFTHALLEQLEKTGWNNKDTFGIHLAMEEAIMNAIRHGNQCCPEKDVHIEIEISGNRFFARITDQGGGFNPDGVPDPTAEENIEKTSGRGLMLMKSFVDEVVFNDRGNSVELTKTKSK